MCATDTIVIDISTSLSSDDVRCTVYLVNPLAANPLDSDSRQTNDWAYFMSTRSGRRFKGSESDMTSESETTGVADVLKLLLEDW